RIAAQLLELTRHLFELIGERALRCAARAVALLPLLTALLLLLCLLELTTGELAELFGEVVDLLIRVLLLRALLRLVLIRETILLELEQLGQLLIHLAAASATAAALLLTLTDFELVQGFDVLQNLERAALRRERLTRLQLLEQLLCRIHFRRGLRQQLR